MANQVGLLIKDAITNAGMTEEELAEKVEIVSLEDIISAENGEKKLTQNQLKAIAKATGVTQKSLLDASKESFPDEEKEAPAEKAAPLSDEDILNLYNSADEKSKQIAVSMLKGEKMPNFDPLAVITNIMSNKELMDKFKAFLASDTAQAILKGAGNIFGGENNNEAYGRSMSVPLMAFTFFYSVTHYILFLSFYFWLWRTDIKPEK